MHGALTRYDRCTGWLLVGSCALSSLFVGGRYDTVFSLLAPLFCVFTLLGRHGKALSFERVTAGCALGFAALTAAAFAVSTVRTSGTAEIARDLLLLASFLVVSGSSAEMRSGLRRTLLRGIALAAIPVCTVGIVVYLAQPFDRFVGTFFDASSTSGYYPNACAAFLLFAWPAAWMLGRGNKFIVPWLGLIFGCLLLTYSRTAYAVLMLQIVALFALDVRRTPAYGRRMALAAVFAILVFGSLNALRGLRFPVLSLPERLAMQDASGAEPLSERRDFWRRAFTLSFERPVFGYGPESFLFTSQKLQRTALSVSDDPHDIVLKYAAERGWPAAIFFMALVAYVLFFSARKLRVSFDPLDCAYLLGVAGIGLHALFDRDFVFLALALPFWIGLGMLTPQGKRNGIQMPKKSTVFAVIFIAFLIGLLFVPDTLDLRLQGAQTAMDLDRPSDAALELRRITALTPVDPRGWTLLGDAEAAAGDDRALAAYDRALDLGGMNYPTITLGILKIAVRRNDPSILRDRSAKIQTVIRAFSAAILRNDHYAALTDVPTQLGDILDQLVILSPGNAREAVRLKDAILQASVKARETDSHRLSGALW